MIDKRAANADIDYIREVMARAQARIDAHAFHGVHWGVIVLVWYPLANFFCSRQQYDASTVLTLGCVLLGTLLSVLRELRLRTRPRLETGTSVVARQFGKSVACCIGAGVLLSIFGPALGILQDSDIVLVWGFVYAALAFMLGVVYSRAYFVSGAVIFVGTVLAMMHPSFAGYILGPCMGLGMIVPSVRSEMRVKKLIVDDV